MDGLLSLIEGADRSLAAFSGRSHRRDGAVQVADVLGFDRMVADLAARRPTGLDLRL